MENAPGNDRDKQDQYRLDVFLHAGKVRLPETSVLKQEWQNDQVGQNCISSHDPGIQIKILRFMDKQNNQYYRQYLGNDVADRRQSELLNADEIPVNIDDVADQPQSVNDRNGMSSRGNEQKLYRIQSQCQQRRNDLDRIDVPERLFSLLVIILHNGNGAAAVVLDTK